MNGTQKLLRKALDVTKPGTRYGLAKRLSMSQSNLQKVLDGRGNIGPKHAVLLADVLDLEPLDVLAVTQYDAAKTAKEKEFWRRKVPRFLSAFALALLTLPHPRAAYSTENGLDRPRGEPIYIMRTHTEDACTIEGDRRLIAPLGSFTSG